MLQKRAEFFQRYEDYERSSQDLRARLTQLREDGQAKQSMKISDLDGMKRQLDRCREDARRIQSESVVLDRLMEQTNSSMTDPTGDKKLVFTVDVQRLLQLIESAENEVRSNRRVNSVLILFFSSLNAASKPKNSIACLTTSLKRTLISPFASKRSPKHSVPPVCPVTLLATSNS